jgi:hypothetical protein
MMLTDEQRQEADRLLLTYTEYTVALRTHIPPETYAKHKKALQADRAAFDAKVADGLAEYMRRSGQDSSSD